MSMSSNRLFSRRFQIALWVVVALLVRVWYLSEQAGQSPLFAQPLLDEQEAVESARALLEGRGLGDEPLFKAPGYTFLLAIVMAVTGDAWPWGIRLIQHLLGALLAGLAFDTASRLTRARGERPWAANLAAAGIVFYGPLIRLESCVVLDSVVVVLQSAMIWALVRWCTSGRPWIRTLWIGIAALLAAAAWMTRPTITPVLPVLAVWIAWQTFRSIDTRPHPKDRTKKQPSAPGQAWRNAMAFLTFPLLAMAVLAARNQFTAGELMVLPWQGGFNFYHANRIGASGRYLTQETVAVSSTGNPTRRIAEEEWHKFRKEQRAEHVPYNYSDIDRWWFGRAWSEIQSDPMRWAGLLGRKGIYLFSDKEIYNYEEYDLQRELSEVLPWAFLRFGLVWPLAAASLVLLPGLPRRRRYGWTVLWIYTVTLGGAIALYYTSGRMRMPLAFPVIVLAAAGLSVLMTSLGRLFSPSPAARASGGGRGAAFVRIVLYAGALCLGALMSWGDWWGVRSERMWHADLARMSNAAWRNGQAQVALNLAEAAAEEKPDYPTVSILRGQALYSLGKIDEAETAFRESLGKLPTDPVAPYNLGVIAYYHRKRPEDASKHYEEALRRDPDYHQAAWRGVLAKLRVGDTEGARALLDPYATAYDPRKSLPPRLLIATIVLACAEGRASTALQLSSLLNPATRKELDEDLQLLGLTKCF